MTSYTLYGYAESGSGAVETALVEADIPFIMEELNSESDIQSARFAAINPRKQVPALVHPDGTVITEVPAILNHLADAHPESGLAPPPGTSARATHDRWLAFLHANVYEAVLRTFYTERYTTDPTGVDGMRAAARAYAIRHLNLFDDAIGDGPFFGGDAPSGVDFLAWIMTTWMAKEDVAQSGTKVNRMIDAMNARAKIKDVVARNTEDAA